MGRNSWFLIYDAEEGGKPQPYRRGFENVGKKGGKATNKGENDGRTCKEF